MKKIQLQVFLLTILIISLLLTGCDNNAINEPINNTGQDDLIVHYLDVGQGDSVLIQFPGGRTAIIDGGTRESGEKIVSYIKNLGVKRLDYLIATHPHEDHIGGLPEVIRNFEVGNVYMPNKTANTKIFEELLNVIENKGLKITIAEGIYSIIDENNLKFAILGPVKDNYSNTNDYSIVSKIEFINTSFIFTGDIEKEAEMDLLEAGYNLKSDVLKVAHHGSSTSNTEEFLEEVAPKYSVISLGKDNAYGHPHKEILERLNKIDTKVLRTDKLGDIVIKSDGENIIVDKVDMGIGGNQFDATLYIGNKNTKIFHSEDCRSLPKVENQVIFNSYEEAIEADYNPHSQCIK